jgi:hypothetical protein
MSRTPETTPAFVIVVELWSVAATLGSVLLLKFLIS